MSRAVRTAIVNPVRSNGSIQAPPCSIGNRPGPPEAARAKYANVFRRTLNTTAATPARMRDELPDGGTDALLPGIQRDQERRCHVGTQGVSPLRQGHTFILDTRSPPCS
jgi:hypothetical protein